MQKLFSIAIGLAIAGVMGLGNIHSASSVQNAPPPATPNAPSAPQAASKVFLPAAYSRSPARTIFGIETAAVTTAGGLPKLIQAGASYVRRNALLWKDVEPTEGTRTWTSPAVVAIEQDLINANANNMQAILIIRGTPAWARTTPNTDCGPIRANKYAAFGTFLKELATRYANPPYNLKYIELGNEPDVDAAYVSVDSVYGCWGISNDPYYGGGAYGQMLQTVYPQIKLGNPNALVLVGGLLLDCDPNSCANPVPPKFFEGALLAGAGSAFDGISFHAYDYYNGNLGRYANANWQAAWNTTGPVVAKKARYLRNLLASKNITGKFLMNTETSLLCYNCPSKNANFETTKAYYVPQSYAVAIVEGLRAQVWYDLNGGWNQSSLDDPTYPQAYNAFVVARAEMQDATTGTEITTYPNVKVYEINRPGKRVWVVWSLDGAARNITLPSLPTTVKDLFGVVGVPSVTFGVTAAPQYVEWTL